MKLNFFYNISEAHTYDVYEAYIKKLKSIIQKKNNNNRLDISNIFIIGKILQLYHMIKYRE